jgi:hypothetical protein
VHVLWGLQEVIGWVQEACCGSSSFVHTTMSDPFHFDLIIRNGTVVTASVSFDLYRGASAKLTG